MVNIFYCGVHFKMVRIEKLSSNIIDWKSCVIQVMLCAVNSQGCDSRVNDRFIKTMHLCTLFNLPSSFGQKSKELQGG